MVHLPWVSTPCSLTNGAAEQHLYSICLPELQRASVRLHLGEGEFDREESGRECVSYLLGGCHSQFEEAGDKAKADEEVDEVGTVHVDLGTYDVSRHTRR